MPMISFSKSYLTEGWHLVYYIPDERHTPNTCSNYIIRFKDGNVKAINAWSQWVVESLIGKGKKYDLCIRALGSSELVAGNKPLDLVGRNIQENLIAPYYPSLLSKTKATPALHTIPTRDGRKAALNGIYNCNDLPEELAVRLKNILLLDDVITSGATSSSIVSVIQTKYPGVNISMFCLAKTSRDAEASEVNKSISLQRFI